MTFHIFFGIVFTDLEICSFSVAICVTLRLLINECQTVTCIPVSVRKCECWLLHEAQPSRVRLELGGLLTPTRGAPPSPPSESKQLLRNATRLCSWGTPALGNGAQALGRAGRAGLGAGEPLSGPELQPLGRAVNSPCPREVPLAFGQRCFKAPRP